MADNETYYEMLWDCAQCNTKGLLGDSHRHCPTCGSAQDPKRRYFPKPGEEIEAKQHKFVGADWSCAFCSSPNSAAAAHCTNCGAGQDGTKPVATIADPELTPPPAPAQSKPGAGRSWLKWALGGLAVVIAMVWILFGVKHDATATVSQRSWAREIQIERLAPVSDAAWCDSVPSDAMSISRTREQRSSRQIEVGKDCHDERSDKGDGTFTKHQVCTPRYRSEPIYDDRCHFVVNRWRTQRSVKASSQDAAMPLWPAVGTLNNQFNSVGSERLGGRNESYTLTLTADRKVWTCNVPEPIWSKYTEGSSAVIKVRLTGGVDCSSLK